MLCVYGRGPVELQHTACWQTEAKGICDHVPAFWEDVKPAFKKSLQLHEVVKPRTGLGYRVNRLPSGLVLVAWVVV